jgi:uncharacterized protein (DUF342 family)
MPDNQTSERRFGILAVKKGFASKEQIGRAFKNQKRLAEQGKSILLGEILIQADVITEKQRDTLLEILKKIEDKRAASDKVEKDIKEDIFAGSKKIQNESGYELTITADKMAAFINPRQDPAPEATLESIKGLFEMEHIKFGVVNDEQIINYLASKPAINKPWKIAQGKPMKPGRPPKIKYYFETDPLKVGTIDESGSIDFKNRGKIPQVVEGAVIAEIIPPTEGVPGRDIYDNPIPPPAYADVSVSTGKGVQRSEQAPLNFVAQTKGRPELKEDGTLCVSEVLTISGDIGIETGHVEFDGHIEVAGSIQEDYRVKGKSLKADEILQSNIEIEGDILVSKGIIGATIWTDGSIRARHIRDAVIDALGDINVETEAYESKIETNGAFNIERGTILCSEISAMRGINAAEIGTDGSAPCNLKVGVDNRMENKIARLNLEIDEKQKGLEELKSRIEELLKDAEALEDKIGELAQEEDKTTVKSRSLNATFEKLKETDDRENITKVLQLLKHVNMQLDQVKTEMAELLAEQEQLDKKIQDFKSQIEKTAAQIQELQDDIDSIIELAKMRKSSAIVRVSGTIYDRTAIRSPKASFTVRDNLKHVTIQEVKKPDTGAEEEWEMIVSSRK